MAVHTIWVPFGWSVEQTWEHIRSGVPVFVDQEQGSWVNVTDDGVLLEPEEE